MRTVIAKSTTKNAKEKISGLTKLAVAIFSCFIIIQTVILVAEITG